MGSIADMLMDTAHQLAGYDAATIDRIGRAYLRDHPMAKTGDITVQMRPSARGECEVWIRDESEHPAREVLAGVKLPLVFEDDDEGARVRVRWDLAPWVLGETHLLKVTL